MIVHQHGEMIVIKTQRVISRILHDYEEAAHVLLHVINQVHGADADPIEMILNEVLKQHKEAVH
jgi:hypothetical protein